MKVFTKLGLSNLAVFMAVGVFFALVFFTSSAFAQLDPPENVTAEVVGTNDVLIEWDAPSGSSATILCVDRDGSADLDFTDDWQNIQPALDAIGASYDYYEVTDLTTDGPDLATMEQYELIIWFCGEGWQSNQTMSDNDEDNLASYLDGGGNLFLSSHDYFWDRYSSAGNFSAGQFPYDYLGVSSTSQDNWNIYDPDLGSFDGAAGSFAAGISFEGQDIYTTAKDGLYLDELVSMDQDLFEVTSPTPAGICACQYDGGSYRTAFTTMSLGAFVDQADLEAVLEGAIGWLSSSSSDELQSFNVFKDGSLLANVTDTEYTDMGLPSGTYEYCVSAVYDEGESVEVCAPDVTISDPGLVPPTFFDAMVVDDVNVYCSWISPDVGEGEWIQWDDGVNDGGIGLTSGGTFEAASRWEPADLTAYDGQTITQISFYANGDAAASYTLKVWTGADAANLIMEQVVSSFVVDDWNQVTLTSSVTIDASDELWFGYEVTHGEGTLPAGRDDGPAIAFNGDMIAFGGATFVSMSDEYSLDYNWNLAAYVVPTDAVYESVPMVKKPIPASDGDLTNSGPALVPNKFIPSSSKALTGFNVYNNIGLVGYTTETNYLDEGLANGNYTYWATAVYDEGESGPSNTDLVLIGGPQAAFFDDFESGISNWEVTGGWGITDEQSHSPSNSLADSPGGDYLPDQETYATMVTGVDLSDPAILSAEVDWWMIMDIENGNFDYLYVEVSNDDFATFTEIASFFGEGMLDPWLEYNYPLGSFLGDDNVRVRFHFSSDAGYEVDGCYIDDFAILTKDYDDAAPEIFFDEPFAYEGTIGDYMVEAEIIDASGITSAEVMYTVDGVAQPNVTGVNPGGNAWTFTIPQQDPGYEVDFVITATDASTSSNMQTTDTASYIAGNYIGYDNAVVDFYTEIGPDGTGGLAGTAVVFTIENPATLVYALIRNYTDQSVGPNDEMVVHVWADGGNEPGDDLIDPITIMPEANLVDTRAFTRVDLRPYEEELSGLIGDVFVGFMVPTGVVRTTISQPGNAGRSFNSSDGVSWTSIGDDYHFRIITGEGGANPYPSPENIMATVVNLNDVNVDWDAPSTGGVTDLEGYNVLRDGEEIAYVAIPATEYDDMDLDAGDYVYCVTAVYEDGESFEICADGVTIPPTEPPPGPTNLVTEVDGEDIILTWDAPGNEWMHWDSGENNGNGIGLTGGGIMEVSSHWDPASLAGYNGLTMTQIQFFANADPDATYTIKVWTGADGMNEVLSQDVSSFVVDDWNVIDLNTPVTIDGTTDLWFGYEVEHLDGTFPAGCDDGPAIAGYGDMIISGGSWVSLVGLAPTLDYNWNIEGYVVAMDGTTQLLGKQITPSSSIGNYAEAGSTGVTSKMNTAGNKSLDEYNVYYSFDGGAFSMIGSTAETTYTDEGTANIVGEHCYEVTAVYDPQGESDPTNESCQVITSVPEFLLNATAVYPNPASDVVNIKSDFEIELIRVYNHAGQIVTDQLINNNMYQLNTSEFNPGLYLFQIETSEGTITKRIIIQ